MAKGSRMGTDPLDSVIGSEVEKPAKSKVKRAEKTAKPTASEPSDEALVKATFRLPTSLNRRINVAVAMLNDGSERRNVTRQSAAIEALEAWVEKAEKRLGLN